MAKPVYPFFAVLKALRGQAGLTVLEAAEATSYTKYERWESGKTAVGAQHLMTIAAAFGIKGDDLGLLIYAWLADRVAPEPGAEPVEVTRPMLLDLLRDVPPTEMDLGPYAALMEQVPTYTDLAVMALCARYRRADGSGVCVPPVVRSYVPRTAGRGGSVLDDLYRDALVELGRTAATTLFKEAAQPMPSLFSARPLANLAPLMARPETYQELAAEAAAAPIDAPEGLARFAEDVLALGADFARLLSSRRQQVVAMLEGVSGGPADQAEVDRLMGSVMTGDLGPVAQLTAAAGERGVLPPADPGLEQEVAALYESLMNGLRAAVDVDLSEAVSATDVGSRMDLLGMVRSLVTD